MIKKKGEFDLIWLKLKEIRSSMIIFKPIGKLEINWWLNWRRKLKLGVKSAKRWRFEESWIEMEAMEKPVSL
jgi:hypothetical protein